MKPESKTGELIGAELAVVPPIHTRTFSTKDAAAAAGISVGKLQNWLTRGAVTLEGELNPGRGQSRTYSAYEIARIVLMKKLSDCGLPLGTAFKITSALKASWKQVAGGHEAYGVEPGVQSWLLVVLAADWPRTRKAHIVRADAHLAVWLVDLMTDPDASSGLQAALLALGAAPVIAVNMGKVLHETISKLEQIV
jgi:transposase